MKNKHPKFMPILRTRARGICKSSIFKLIFLVLPISYLITLYYLPKAQKHEMDIAPDLVTNSFSRPSRLSTNPPKKSSCQWSNDNKQFVKLGSPELSRAYLKESLKTPLFPNFSWSNVVVMIMTYNDESENKLIQKHFDSWIHRMPKGLDILFITDSSDRRNYTEALPQADKVPPTIYLHHSPGTGEGAQARKKMVDTLRATYEIYKDKKEKEIFIKIDPDTYMIPENMIKTMNKIHKATYPLPVDFGRVDCTKMRNGDCYSLGASYGLNKEGLAATLQYINKHPEVFNQLVLKYGKIIKNRMRDEDFFISHVFHEATCLPTIHVPGMSIRLHARNYEIRGPIEAEWDKTKEHITIHLAEEPGDFDMLNKFYYDKNGHVNQMYRV